MIPALHLIFEFKGLKPPRRKKIIPVLKKTNTDFFCCCYKCVLVFVLAEVNANPDKLQALHAEHLQDEFDVLQQHFCEIQAKHGFLANQLRSKVV